MEREEDITQTTPCLLIPVNGAVSLVITFLF